MNSIISFPGKIANIGSEIDYHGNAVTQEIRVMHSIIDSHGKGIENEMQLMRESFENEMRNMQKKTKQICITVLAVNVLSRVFLR
jgi:hypothetical protein